MRGCGECVIVADASCGGCELWWLPGVVFAGCGVSGVCKRSGCIDGALISGTVFLGLTELGAMTYPIAAMFATGAFHFRDWNPSGRSLGKRWLQMEIQQVGLPPGTTPTFFLHDAHGTAGIFLHDARCSRDGALCIAIWTVGTASNVGKHGALQAHA
jgi:hypothetical protein